MKLGERSQRMATASEHHQQTRILVQAAAAACEDKKGVDTRILELDPIDAGLSDFFLVTSATNDRQCVAIADEIEGRLKKEFGATPNSVEGRRQGEWILLDYVDFVVHVFLVERRAFYDIERLRKSARPLTPAEFARRAVLSLLEDSEDYEAGILALKESEGQPRFSLAEVVESLGLEGEFSRQSAEAVGEPGSSCAKANSQLPLREAARVA